MTSIELEQNKDYQNWKEKYAPKKDIVNSEEMSWQKYQITILGHRELIDVWMLHKAIDKKGKCEFMEWAQICGKETPWWFYAVICPDCKWLYVKQTGDNAKCVSCEKEFKMIGENKKVHWVCREHQGGESDIVYDNVRQQIKEKELGAEE